MSKVKITLLTLLVTLISIGFMLNGLSMVATLTIEAPQVQRANALSPDVDQKSSSRVTFPTNDDWAYYLKDYRHTSFSNSTVPTTNKTLWVFPQGTNYIGAYSSPIIVYDTVYVSGLDDKVYSLDIRDGSKNWEYSMQMSMYASPTYFNGILYIGNTNGWIRAIYANNGTQKWEKQLMGAIESTGLVLDGRLYLGCRNDYFYCFNASNGAELWKYKINDTSSSPAYDEGKLYINSKDHKMFRFDVATGGQDWNVTFESSPLGEEYSSPLIVGDYMYIGTEKDGWLYCMWKSNGTTKWKYPVGKTCATPSYGYGHIFIPNDAGQIFKLTPEGSEVWNKNLGSAPNPFIGGIYNAISIADGKLLITHNNGSMYCLNATDGHTVWMYNPNEQGDYITSAPALAYGVVVSVLGDGKVYCFGNYTAPDYTPPTVTSNSPSNGQTGVGLTANITVTFSEQMAPLTVTAATLYLQNGTMSNVTGTVTYSIASKTATFDPALSLNYSTTYTFKVTSTLTDLAGLGLDGDKDGVVEGTGIDDIVFTFMTQAANAPGITTIPVQHPTEGIEHLLDLSPFVTDSDTPLDILTISENSSYVEVMGHNLSFIYPEGVLNDCVNLTVSDATSSAFQIITVEVISVNNPPVFVTIPDIDLYEDTPHLLNISEYVLDIDTPLSDLDFSTNASASKLTAVFEGTNLTLTYIKQNGPYPKDSAVLNISAFDQTSTIYVDVNLNLIPVSDAPTIEAIDPVTVTTGIPLDIHLSGHVSDVDNSLSELTLSEDSMYVTADGLDLTLLYPDGAPAQESVNVSVNDGLLSAWTILEVTIIPGNSAPELSGPKATPVSGDETTLFKFSVGYTDTDAYQGNLSLSDQAEHASVYLVLNNTEYKMELVSGDLRSGSVFEFERGFSAGQYSYHFRADDLSGNENSEAKTVDQTMMVTQAAIDTGDDDDTDKTVFAGTSLLLTILGVIALVIVAVLVIVLIIVVRKKKSSEEQLPAPQQSPVTAQAPAGPEASATPPLQQAADTTAPPAQQGPEPVAPAQMQQTPTPAQAPDLQPPQTGPALPGDPSAAPPQANNPVQKQ